MLSFSPSIAFLGYCHLLYNVFLLVTFMTPSNMYLDHDTCHSKLPFISLLAHLCFCHALLSQLECCLKCCPYVQLVSSSSLNLSNSPHFQAFYLLVHVLDLICCMFLVCLLGHSMIFQDVGNCLLILQYIFCHLGIKLLT